MHIHLPNSALLQNAEGMFRRIDPADPTSLHVSFHPSWVWVHPAVLALTACAGALVRHNGGTVTTDELTAATAAYPVRMKLFDALGVTPPMDVIEHEPAGRFVPVTSIRTPRDLSDFIVDIIPLLHADPSEIEPIQYVMSELIRNALEHSHSPIGAFVCAQYFPKSKRVAIGVADAGIGIQGAMSPPHPVRNDLDAIQLALRPGITGTTTRVGGTEYNAGAGLFFTKAIATASNNYFVSYSGTAYFKLLKTRNGEDPVINADPAFDRARRYGDFPHWPGTVMGIDVSTSSRSAFESLMDSIREAYHSDVKAIKKGRYKKPRFM